MTCVRATVNLQASQNVDQRIMNHKERAVNEISDPREHISRSNQEGQLKVHKSKEMTTEGILDSFWNSTGIRAQTKALKGELDELSRLLDCGSVVSPKKTYHHMYGVGLDGTHANEVLVKSCGESQVRTKVVDVEPQAKEGDPSILNLEAEILDAIKDNCSMFVDVFDTNPVEGLGTTMEQEIGIGLANRSALVIEKQ